MKKCFLLLFFAVGVFNSYSQSDTMIVDGVKISVYSDSVFIGGSVIFKNNDSIKNSGDIYITGNWTNNGASNNVFLSGNNGWVHLTGATQTIGGSNFTRFNKLELSGTGIKQLNNVDAEVEDTLALNDREFSAGDKVVRVTGTNAGLVTRSNTLTGGFVSSTNDGGLSRNTASAGAYTFPVGSSTGTVRYRPVDLTPNAVSANTFKVRMANVNPNTDIGNTIGDSICDINSNYYHRIYQTTGTSAADVKIYYDAVTDGNYQTIAHWQNIPRWENTGNNSTGSVPPLSSLSVNSWSNFTTNHFALAKFIPIASISTNAACKGSNAVFTAPPNFANYEFFVNGVPMQNGANNSYSSNSLNSGDSVKVILYDVITCQSINNAVVPVTINPSPNVAASNNDTITLGESSTLVASGANSYLWQPDNQTGSTITVSPTEETTYTVIGTDAKGCTDTATVTVFIDSKCVHWLPNIFSPNGDGENDELKVYGKNLDQINLTIYDRWGNKVFYTENVSNTWDGKFKGDMLNTGVFVYILKGKCLGSGEEFDQHGNVTLTR